MVLKAFNQATCLKKLTIRARQQDELTDDKWTKMAFYQGAKCLVPHADHKHRIEAEINLGSGHLDPATYFLALWPLWIRWSLPLLPAYWNIYLEHIKWIHFINCYWCLIKLLVSKLSQPWEVMKGGSPDFEAEIKSKHLQSEAKLSSPWGLGNRAGLLQDHVVTTI